MFAARPIVVASVVAAIASCEVLVHFLQRLRLALVVLALVARAVLEAQVMNWLSIEVLVLRLLSWD